MPSKYYEGFVTIFTLKIIISAAQIRDSIAWSMFN